MSNQFENLLKKKIDKAKYIPHVISFLKFSKIKKKFISSGIPQSILSDICNKKKLKKYFTKIYGSPSKKNQHIKDIKKKYKLKNSELIFFGDSESDYYAAKSENILFVKVGNGIIKNKCNYQIEHFKSKNINQ